MSIVEDDCLASIVQRPDHSPASGSLFSLRKYFEALGADEPAYDVGRWQQALEKLDQAEQLCQSAADSDRAAKQQLRLGFAIWNAAVRLTAKASEPSDRQPSITHQQALQIDAQLRAAACRILSEPIRQTRDEFLVLTAMGFADTTCQKFLAADDVAQARRFFELARDMRTTLKSKWPRASQLHRSTRGYLTVLLACSEAQILAKTATSCASVEDKLAKAKRKAATLSSPEQQRSAVEELFNAAYNCAVGCFARRILDQARLFCLSAIDVFAGNESELTPGQKSRLARAFRLLSAVFFDSDQFDEAERAILRADGLEHTLAGALTELKIIAKAGHPQQKLRNRLAALFAQPGCTLASKLAGVELLSLHPDGRPLAQSALLELQAADGTAHEDWLELQLRLLRMSDSDDTGEQTALVDGAIDYALQRGYELPPRLYNEFVSWMYATASDEFAAKRLYTAAHWASKLLQFLRPVDTEERGNVLLFLARVFLDDHRQSRDDDNNNGGQPRNDALADALDACRDAGELLPHSLAQRFLLVLLLAESGSDDDAAREVVRAHRSFGAEPDRPDLVAMLEASAYEAHVRMQPKTLFEAWNALLLLFEDDAAAAPPSPAAVDEYLRVAVNLARLAAGDSGQPGLDGARQLAALAARAELFLRTSAADSDEQFACLASLTWNGAAVAGRDGQVELCEQLFHAAHLFAQRVQPAARSDDDTELMVMALLLSACALVELLNRQRTDARFPEQLAELRRRVAAAGQHFAGQPPAAGLARALPLYRMVACSLLALSRDTDGLGAFLRGVELEPALPPRFFASIAGIVKSCDLGVDALALVYRTAIANSTAVLQQPARSGKPPPVGDYCLQLADLLADDDAERLQLFRQMEKLLIDAAAAAAATAAADAPPPPLFANDQLQWLVVHAYNTGVKLLRRSVKAADKSQCLLKSEQWLSMALFFLRQSPFAQTYYSTVLATHTKVLAQLNV